MRDRAATRAPLALPCLALASAASLLTAIPSLSLSLSRPPQALADHAATRVFRWPDGSLRKEKPPAKRNVVEARAEWEDIVDYCRRTGGCPHCAQGACLRHGFGVSARDHENYCREIGVWNQPVQDLKEKIYMEKCFQ